MRAMNKIRRRRLMRLTTLFLLLIVLQVFGYTRGQDRTVQIAVAKGQQMLEMISGSGVPLNATAVQQSLSTHNRTADLLVAKDALFVDALPMSRGEARQWADDCGHLDCAYVTYFNPRDGGTINSILNLQTNELVDLWQEMESRPPGSTHVLGMAMDIAAASPEVRSVLGDIGDVDPAMIPMSAWLADSPCREEWCVDLTFHDPSGSGKVYHVFVNMEREEVARTFFTRGRPELDVPAPVSQRGAYTDGCHEQYGWEVCWEMTAHDGVLFRDATYNGGLIFLQRENPAD
jgi:hypothetical protein